MNGLVCREKECLCRSAARAVLSLQPGAQGGFTCLPHNPQWRSVDMLNVSGGARAHWTPTRKSGFVDCHRMDITSRRQSPPPQPISGTSSKQIKSGKAHRRMCQALFCLLHTALFDQPLAKMDKWTPNATSRETAWIPCSSGVWLQVTVGDPSQTLPTLRPVPKSKTWVTVETQILP